MLTLPRSWVAIGNQGVQLVIWNQPGEYILQTDSKGEEDVSVGSDLATTRMHPFDGLD